MTNPIEAVKTWIFGIALKKAAYFVVKIIVGFISGAKVAPVLSQLGVTVDPVTMTAGVATFVGAGLTIVQNWVKVKFGWNWL
jgi:hypothetical protein